MIAKKASYQLNILQKIKAGVYIFIEKDSSRAFCGGNTEPLKHLVEYFTKLRENKNHMHPLHIEMMKYPKPDQWEIYFHTNFDQKNEEALELETAKAVISYNSLQPNGFNSSFTISTMGMYNTCILARCLPV